MKRDIVYHTGYYVKLLVARDELFNINLSLIALSQYSLMLEEFPCDFYVESQLMWSVLFFANAPKFCMELT